MMYLLMKAQNLEAAIEACVYELHMYMVNIIFLIQLKGHTRVLVLCIPVVYQLPSCIMGSPTSPLYWKPPMWSVQLASKDL